MDFDGAGDAINTSAGGTLSCLNGTPAGTMTMWFTPDVSESNCLMSWSVENGGTPTNTSRMRLDRNGSDIQVQRGRADDGAGENTITDPGGVPPNGVQRHVCGVVNVAGDSMSLFINGALGITSAVAFTPAVFETANSACGAIMSEANTASLSDESDGKAEDVRIYQRALSEAEASTITACRGHDGIWFGIHHRWTLFGQPPATVAAGALSIIDVSNQKFPATPVGAPVYEETRLSYRRRYL